MQTLLFTPILLDFLYLRMTMQDKELPKAYDAQATEDAIYEVWMKSQYFSPDHLPNLDKRKEAFTIILPPPNVTGTLHMGHAVMLAIEDAMVRYARMSGKASIVVTRDGSCSCGHGK